MKTSITKGLDAEKKQEIVQEFNSSALLRAQLIKVMNEKIEASRKHASDPERYKDPAWAFLQADVIGYERACKEIISLLS